MARVSEQKLLERFMMLSIAAAITTMFLKGLAAWLTGSVGFLSDALESSVNLVAAIAGLFALKVSAKPADKEHQFGHGKAEYLSALAEGAMIFVAAGAIIYTAIERLIVPQPVEEAGWGLTLSTLSSVIHLAVGVMLIRAGKHYRSATLQADGQHLMTDVWTSVGVLVGMAAVYLTGWWWMDPVIALVVGVNILWAGYNLLKNSVSSLLSEALPEAEIEKIQQRLDAFEEKQEVSFTERRTVAFGRQRMVYLTMEVPAQWTVQRSHDVADEVEATLDELYPGCEVFIHVEPAGAPHRRASHLF